MKKVRSNVGKTIKNSTNCKEKVSNHVCKIENKRYVLSNNISNSTRKPNKEDIDKVVKDIKETKPSV